MYIIHMTYPLTIPYISMISFSWSHGCWCEETEVLRTWAEARETHGKLMEFLTFFWMVFPYHMNHIELFTCCLGSPFFGMLFILLCLIHVLSFGSSSVWEFCVIAHTYFIYFDIVWDLRWWMCGSFLVYSLFFWSFTTSGFNYFPITVTIKWNLTRHKRMRWNYIQPD